MKISDLPFGISDGPRWSPPNMPAKPAAPIGAPSASGTSASAWWNTRRATARITGASKATSCCVWRVLHTTLADGRSFTLTPGLSYQVADDAEPHLSHTETGAKLFIVD